MVAAGLSEIRHPANIACLSISVALVPAFGFWVARQERLEKPALIPNSLWKDSTFTSICLVVILSYAVMNTMELFCCLL